MRAKLNYLLLLALKWVSRLLWRCETRWLGDPPEDPWAQEYRIVAILHHTSLYEPIFAAAPDNAFLRRIAGKATVPIAKKTLDRPLVGAFFKLVAGNVVPITRKRDETWREVVRRTGPDSMVIILPEGRMMRPGGLDAEGKPMTVRGGIADLIQAVGEGLMLIAYSGGLHHVQAPGEALPRLFRTIRLNLEVVDIGEYRRELLARAGEDGFRRAVKADLEERRDRHCPTGPESPHPSGRADGELGAAARAGEGGTVPAENPDPPPPPPEAGAESPGAREADRG